MCDMKNCKCIQRVKKQRITNSLCEYHADLFAANWLYANKCIDAIKIMAQIANKQKISRRKDAKSLTYINAAKRIMKKRIWRKCLKLIGEK